MSSAYYVTTPYQWFSFYGNQKGQLVSHHSNYPSVQSESNFSELHDDNNHCSQRNMKPLLGAWQWIPSLPVRELCVNMSLLHVQCKEHNTRQHNEDFSLFSLTKLLKYDHFKSLITFHFRRPFNRSKEFSFFVWFYSKRCRCAKVLISLHSEKCFTDT